MTVTTHIKLKEIKSTFNNMGDNFINTSIKTKYKSFFLPVALAKLLPSFFLIIITILFSRKLNKLNYGVFQTTWVYFNILCIAINFGISSLILSSNLINFILLFKKYKIQIFGFYIVIIFLFFSITFKIVPNIEPPILIAIFIYTLLQSLGSIIDSLLIKLEEVQTFTFFNILYSCLFFIIHIYFYFNEFNLFYILISLIIISSLKLLLVFFIKLPITDANIKVDKKIISNWVFIGITTIIGVFAMWLDKIYIQFIMPPDKFALFFNGAIELPFFGILIGAMETIMLQNISLNLNNTKKTIEIFKESINVLSIISIPLFFCFLAIYNETFELAFNNTYNESAKIFFVYIFLIPLRITHFGVILQCYNKAQFVTIGALLDLALSLFLMNLLYPIYGTLGVAFALVFSTYLQAIFYLYKSARILNTKMLNLIPTKNLLQKVFLNFLLFVPIYLSKNFFSNYIFLIGTILIYSLVIAYYCYQYWIQINNSKKIIL